MFAQIASNQVRTIQCYREREIIARVTLSPNTAIILSGMSTPSVSLQAVHPLKTMAVIQLSLGTKTLGVKGVKVGRGVPEDIGGAIFVLTV